MKKLPDLKKEAGRKYLAQWLCKGIEAGKQQYGNLPERWSRLEKMAKQVPTDEGSGYDEQSVPRTFPLMSAKVDSLVGAVCGPVLTSHPYFTAIGYGASKPMASKGQEVVQFVYERTGFDSWFRKSVRVAAKAEPALTFYYFDPEDSEIKVDVIHPRDFVLYPAYVGGIEKAVICADRFWMRAADIRENDKFYDEAKKITGGQKPEDESYTSPISSDPFSNSMPDDQPVECYRAFAKIAGQWHLCRVAVRTKTLLSCEPYGVTIQGMESQGFVPHLRPGYFPVFLQESEGNEFLREVPVAHKMQAIQVVFDKLINCMIDGSEMNAAPPVIATGAIGDAGKLIEYEPNSVLSMQGDIKLFPLPVQFRAGEMPQLITLMSELADSASRVSPAGEGQQFSGSPTATEVAGVLSGQKMGLDEYRANACQGPSEGAEFIIELVSFHFVEMLRRYGDDFPVQSVTEMAGDYTFQPTGKTIESTPGALIEKVKLAMEMAQQMVMAGLLPPQILVEFFKVLLDTLSLPIEDHVISQYLSGIGPSPLPLPGMGMPPGMPGLPGQAGGGGMPNVGAALGALPAGAGSGALGNPPVPGF